MIRPSHGTISPASILIKSPTTISEAGISTVFSSLSTFAKGAERFFRLARDFSAFTYCTVPKIALRIITEIITIVLSMFPVVREIVAATIKIATRTSLN